MTRFMGLDLIISMNWTRGSLWPIMGLTTQTNHQLAINALNAQGYHMVSPPCLHPQPRLLVTHSA